MKFSLFLLFCIGLGLISCTKDVGPNPDLIKKVDSSCDTITFTKHISSIFTNKCVVCHQPGATSPDLSTYSLIKTQVDGGRIKARVFDQIPSVMPQGGALPQNELDLIKCWLDAGAPNN